MRSLQPIFHMKYLFALMFLPFFLPTATAQTTWFEPTDQWTFYVVSGWVGEGIEQIKPEKDTLIGGLSYKKLRRTAQFSSGAAHSDFRLVRQDGPKVYALQASVSGLPEEFLMYDFSLKTGDTLRMPFYDNQEIGYIVTAVSSVNIGGKTRVEQRIQWWNLPNFTPVQRGTIIEGIGCTEGVHTVGGADCLSNSYLFLDEPSALAVDGEERTFCSFQSGATTFEGLGNVHCRALPAQSPAEAQVSVYPSLSRGTLYFSAPAATEMLEVGLYDLAGKQILQTALRDTESLTTDYKGAAVVVVKIGDKKATTRVVFY
jgi:hypothetical protein